MDTLKAVAQRYHPSLKGTHLRSPELSIDINRDNHLLLTQLYNSHQQQHPEAGHAYWSVRCWASLIWQPLYLSLVAVHGCRYPLQLAHLYQHIHQLEIAGFSLSEPQRKPIESPGEEFLIETAAEQIRSYLQSLISQCRAAFDLRPRLAIRLAADTLLSGLIRLPVIKPSVNNQDILLLAERWLDALNWQEESRLMPVTLNNNRQHLALNRKSCCFDYRCANGAVCATCPKQSLSLRKTRISDSLSKHV